MKVIFKIEYQVNNGESLHIVGGLSIDMTSADGTIWSAECFVENQQYRYNYVVRRSDGTLRCESFGAEHIIEG